MRIVPVTVRGVPVEVVVVFGCDAVVVVDWLVCCAPEVWAVCEV